MPPLASTCWKWVMAGPACMHHISDVLSRAQYFIGVWTLRVGFAAEQLATQAVNWESPSTWGKGVLG